LNFEYLQAQRDNVDITFHWNKKLEQYEDNINAIFMFLNLDYLQLQREMQIERKCKQFFEFLKPKKDLIQRGKKFKCQVKVVKTLNKWCKQSSSNIFSFKYLQPQRKHKKKLQWSSRISNSENYVYKQFILYFKSLCHTILCTINH
jgi:hypothetical protein